MGTINTYAEFMAEAERLDPDGFAEARAELAEATALRKDAERYRWLRDHSEPGICAFYLSVGKAFDGVKFARATVDEAIDAQIAALTLTHNVAIKRLP